MLKSRQDILSWGKFLIGWPLSIISVGFILKLVFDNKNKINLNFSDITFFYLITGIVFFVIYFLLRSFLWQKLLREKGGKISFTENTYRFAFSEIKRYTPGNIWSFLSRASMFQEAGIEKNIVGVSLLADIQLVIIGCGIFSLFSVPWILNSENELKLKLISLLPFSLIAVVIYFVVIGLIYSKKYDKSEKLLNSFVMPGFSLNSKIKVTLISVVTYAFFGMANFFVLLSIYSIGFNYLLILSSFFVFALLVGYLSFITPMGLGIRELIVTLGLSQIVNQTDAGAISIFTRLSLVVTELSLLLFIFLWKKYLSKQ